MEENIENTAIGEVEPTMLECAFSDGQSIQVPAFFTPEGGLSILLPSDYNISKDDKILDLLNLPLDNNAFELGASNQEEIQYLSVPPGDVQPLEAVELDNQTSPAIEIEKPKLKRGKKPKSVLQGYRELTCDVCAEKFYSQEEYQKHNALHYIKEHQCNKCDMTFNVYKNLVLHLATHLTGEDLSCPECFKKFSRVAAFKAHLLFHEVVDNVVCPECFEEFPYDWQLMEHRKIRHELENGINESGKFKCSWCRLSFSNSSSLEIHENSHYVMNENDVPNLKKRKKRVGKRSNRCTECNKVFLRYIQCG